MCSESLGGAQVKGTHLRAECGLFMEVAAHKVTILPCGDPTLPVNPYAARVTDDFACHVLCCVDLFGRCYPLAADWPSCYVVRPLVRRDRRWFFAVAERERCITQLTFL